MAKEEVLDSQILVENVSFSNKSLDVVVKNFHVLKEYIEGEQSSQKNTNSSKGRAIRNESLNTSLNRSLNVPSQTNSKNLQEWGLPTEIASKYAEKGITEMFDWQVKCLANSLVLLDCCNLLYSAPTSAGKTLVAEILAIKTILERQKKVIIILPFVSIVREKMFYFQDIFASSGIRVEGFVGSRSPPGGLQSVHIAICTIEKANSLVNRLLDDGNISELGAVIVDELHLLGDPHRGYILELLLTKIKYVSYKSDEPIQIIGMSATLPNLDTLAKWLNAELYVTQFRPIPLEEYCLVENKLFYYDKTDIKYKILKYPIFDSLILLELCLETIKEGCSTLIFCFTKNRCESLAQSLASSFYEIGSQQQSEKSNVLRNQLSTERISEVLEQLKNCPVGLDQILKKTVSFGVAYHHAGLTLDERDIIEGGFKSGALRVLVATSTLSSGVNLPARRVIVRSPVFRNETINILTYKQMIGRAGRMGKDTKGESIVMCGKAQQKIGLDLMKCNLEPVKSCIETEDKYMRIVLEMIASQVICKKEELELYSRCTLLYTEKNMPSEEPLLDSTLQKLQYYELIRKQEDGDNISYVATSLGKACLSASMAPNDGLTMFIELQKARQCLVLETDLHLIYLVTPFSVSGQWADINWLYLLNLWQSSTKATKRVGELVGVEEQFLIRLFKGFQMRSKTGVNQLQDKLEVHKRFYTALALQDLVNEVPLSEVAAKFQCPRGFLQSLQQAAATFAGMVTAFCRQLGWKNMEVLISQFQDRLHFGVHSELLDLMKLPSLNGVRARALFDAGFETVSSIASADALIIENILHRAVPFQSEKQRGDDDLDDVKKRNKMKSIWITGYCGMTAKDAAKNLILEARKQLAAEIGGEINWANNAGLDNKLENENNNPLPECSNTERDNHSVKIEEEINEKGHSNKPNLARVSENFLEDSFEDETNKDKSVTVKGTTVKELISSSNTRSLKVENDEKSEQLKSIPAAISSPTSPLPTTSAIKDEIVWNTLHSISVEIPSPKSTLPAIKDEIVWDTLESIPVAIPSPKSALPTTSPIKDEIVWDTLEFTETSIGNVTRLRNEEKNYSPNISFGENDKSENNYDGVNSKENGTSNLIYEGVNPNRNGTNVKDISLFSSDGDNSSLFNDSLPLDMIPTKLLDNNNTPAPLKRETTTDFVNLNSNTMLNVFKSPLVAEHDTIIIEDDEEIKKEKLPECSRFINENEVVCSQETISIDKFKSPLKRSFKEKSYKTNVVKKKRHNEHKPVPISNEPKSVPISNFLNSSLNKLSNKVIIKIKNHNINCFLLKGNDLSINFPLLDNVETSAIFLVFNKPAANNDVIGRNALKVPKAVTNELILGIALCISEDTCIYLDFSCLTKSSHFEKFKLRWWFQKRTRLLKTFSLLTNYTHLRRWLGVSVTCTFSDVSTMEWLISMTHLNDINSLAQKYDLLDKSPLKDSDVRLEACLNAFFIWMITDQQMNILQSKQILDNIIAVENKTAVILAECEYQGIKVDKELVSQMLIDVKQTLDMLQKNANKLAGFNVDINSSKSVAKALGMKGNKVSTKKSVLSCHTSPLSSIIMYWRKLNCILIKTLYPLAKTTANKSYGERVNPSYTMHTCTGRISMHEPNLQNVPRTFTIPAQLYLGSNDLMEVNCRNIFKASPGYVMVSADYCQLEMRILTHFSEDQTLVPIMRSEDDIFKSIAASWSDLPEEQVDDDLRQKAKQLCYGILYGMGHRTLAQNLDVTEIEAAYFVDTFYKTFFGVRKYTESIVKKCSKDGYVETLMKRRRYLPNINSKINEARCAAERQAVNTTIQGSAADIAKAAMCAIHDKISELNLKPRLLLQLHDELIYEVPENDKEAFIKLLKETMEGTVKLKVPLPVKVKCGYSWGSLQPVQCTQSHSIK